MSVSETPIRVAAAGDWSQLDDLLAALALRAEFVADACDAEVALVAGAGPDLPANEIAALRELTRAPILLLAAQPSTRLLADAIGADIADVLPLPQEPDAILFAAVKALQLRHGRAPAAGGTARVITVFSPKGGTGKSVTATNVAASLASAGRRTLLLDLDVQFGDAAVMLGLEPVRTLYDVATAPGALDGEKLVGYTTRHESGLDVISAPLRPEDAELITDAKVAEIIASASAVYDVVVVDTPPFFHGGVLAALDRTDELVLLLAPDVPTLKNVRLALQTLELLSFPPERIRFVLNRMSPRLGFGSGDIAAVLERPLDFELPDDEAAAIGVNRGVPSVLCKPRAPYSLAVTRMAERLVSASPAPAAHRRRFSFARPGR